MIKFNTIKRDQIKEGSEGAAPPTESKNTPATEAKGDNLDEFGYEKAPAVNDSGKEDKEPPKDGAKETKKESEKIEDPSTGYGVKPPKVDEETPPPKEEKKIELGYELEVKDIPAEEVIKLKEFAKNNALTKEAAQALVNLRKSEIDEANKADEQYVKDQAKAVTELKASWDKELRTDPVFGGDKFDRNLMRVEKVLKEYLGETKKVLTERKSMLPPYVMRDLAKLADHLYSTEKFVQGDASKADDKAEEKEVDHLDFYR